MNVCFNCNKETYFTFSKEIDYDDELLENYEPIIDEFKIKKIKHFNVCEDCFCGFCTICNKDIEEINEIYLLCKYYKGFSIDYCLPCYFLNKINDYNEEELQDKLTKLENENKRLNKIQDEIASFFEENGFENQDDIKNFIIKNKNNENNSSNDINKINILSSSSLNNLEKKIKFINNKNKNNTLRLDVIEFRKDVIKYLLNKKKLKKQRNILLDEFKTIKLNIKEKIFDEIDSILDKINKEHMLVECKNKDCKQLCYDDIGVCLQHYPDICSECDKILDRKDKLINNKKAEIKDCCYSCSYKKYFDYFVKNYGIDNILYIFDENDDLYNTKKAIVQKNYYEIEQDMLILDDIKNREDLLKKEIIELYGYTFDENSEYNKYNDFTKYKLYNRLTRSKDIITSFGRDKLKNIKIKPSFYAYMGKLEYYAFKDFLKVLLESYNINNSIEIEDLCLESPILDEIKE